jgi:hypothetical protein
MITSAKSLKWKGWTKTEKPYDRDRPFHRINAPSMHEDELPQPGELNADGSTTGAWQTRVDNLRRDGLGYKDGAPDGCHIPTDIPFASLTEVILSAKRDPRNIVRTVPSWILIEDEQIKEAEGLLLRCYQTWTDFPLFQWHRWYDWNFMLSPAPGYGYLRSKANTPPVLEDGDDKKNGFNQVCMRDFDEHGEKSTANTMECEFDCGLFGSRFRPNVSSPQSFGPMFEADLNWPMTGQYFWGMGRWIYDCAHPTSDAKTAADVNPKNESKRFIGLTRSELHPCRAVATARWEAFNFPENGDAFVPAIQFMFFATRLGGYIDEEHPVTLPREDIEFIVDLPEFKPAPDYTFPIGHTPDIAHNTITLRPRLLHKAVFDNFENAIASTHLAGTPVLKSSRIEPIIEALRPQDANPQDGTSQDAKDPNTPPKQVKVTIPMSKVPASDDFYGFNLALGWRDIDRTQSQKVKTFKVTLQQVDVGALMHDEEAFAGSTGEWQVRIGVNGRWAQKRQENVKANSTIQLATGEPAGPPEKRHFEFLFHLAEEDFISLSAHGEETDTVHDTYKDRTDQARILMLPSSQLVIPLPFTPNVNFGGRPVQYFADCINWDRDRARAIVTAIEDDQFTTLGIENDPLGRIDPFHKTNEPDGSPVRDRLQRTSSDNPMLVTNIKNSGPFFQIGLVSKEVGKSAELAEKPGFADYTVVYTIEEIPPTT